MQRETPSELTNNEYFILETDVVERPPEGIADDKAFFLFF